MGFTVGLALGLLSGCTADSSIRKGTGQVLPAGPECARVHHLWRPQIEALPLAERSSVVGRWVETVYRPFPQFWNGYLGDEDAFRGWATDLKIAADPRLQIPQNINVEARIRRVTSSAGTLARQPLPCSDWYLVLGPGWTNMGGLGKTGMVVDFLGIPRQSVWADFDHVLAHEVNHLMWSAARPTASSPTLLDRVIDEGFATYFAQVHSGGAIDAAQSLGYTAEEWNAALEAESALWEQTKSLLRSGDAKLINRYMAAGEQLIPKTAGKIGYFLGYRIIAAYVARHGPESWMQLYGMPATQILATSGYRE